ncbi:DUF6985 domain-containing protein [Aeoliella sp. SH292]|uniref:DUF6985 domain-containing protein n=1 Tax=Aeoliella sp. SH292 TaxID=3454464 RepID=UPI003F9C3418
MNIEPLGDLLRDDDIEDWFVSEYIAVPYVGGAELQFILDGIEDDNSPEDFSDAIKQFLALSMSERNAASPYVFGSYQRFVELVGEDELDFTIGSKEEVWQHVFITGVHVSRRHWRDKEVYVQLTGNCDWEQEHGIQIVLRRGHILARVSDQDGHLTTADAYNLPENQNTIVYEG